MSDVQQDQIKLTDNGHVELTIEGNIYDCRRPKASEYLALTEQAIMAEKTIKDSVSGDAAGDITERLMASTSEEQIKSNRVTLEVMGDWFISLLQTLSATPFEGTRDDLPPWVISNMSTAIMIHWATVPLVQTNQGAENR